MRGLRPRFFVLLEKRWSLRDKGFSCRILTHEKHRLTYNEPQIVSVLGVRVGVIGVESIAAIYEELDYRKIIVGLRNMCFMWEREKHLV